VSDFYEEGIYSRNHIGISLGLPGDVSRCTGEILAIWRALEEVRSLNIRRSVIYSDSRSALSSIVSVPDPGDDHVTYLVK